MPQGPASRILELQRTAGNRATTALLQRAPKVPSSTDLLGPVPRPFEGATTVAEVGRLPAPLRTVVGTSAKATGTRASTWWARLSDEQRRAVTSLYNRFQSSGLWGYVHRMRRVVPGEAPWCGLKVSGDTPSIEFHGDASGLLSALMASHEFCYDQGIGGSLHKGQTSVRQISTSDSLHISVGKGSGNFDAHIDRYAPPKGKKKLACEYDPERTMLHQGREVVPALIRKGFKLDLFGRKVRIRGPGGVELFPEDPKKLGARPELFDRPSREDDPGTVAGVSWRF